MTTEPPRRSLTRNILLNVGGQILQLVLSVAAVPFVVRSLGTDRYGILALGVLLLGYLSLLDLGIPRAATKLVSESLGSGRPERVSSVFWISATVSLAAGLIAGALLAGGAGFLVRSAFSVPAAQADEARQAFRILSGSVAASILTSALTGFLEAYQRFDLVNLLRIPSNLLTQMLTLTGAVAGLQLPGILLLLLAKNVVFAAAAVALCLRQLPSSRRGYRWEGDVARSMMGFAGWSSVSAVASVILGYMDRLLIGLLLGASAVAFYAVPQQITAAYLTIVGGLMAVLFPAFTRDYESDRARLRETIVRAWTVIAGLGTYCAFVLAVGGRDLLLLWMGPSFVDSAPALQVLGGWSLVASLTWLLSTLLQATAFVRTMAMTGVVALIVQAAATFYWLPKLGLAGPALAALMTQVLVLVVLLAMGFKAELTGRGDLLRPRLLLPCAGLLLCSVPLLVLKRYWSLSPVLGLALPVFCGFPFALLLWRVGLDEAGRALFRGALRSALSRRTSS